MKRILIIGSNGAGKSTFSCRLAERTRLPLIHIDKLYWRNHWEVTPRQEFEELVCVQAKKPEWIIEGNKIDDRFFDYAMPLMMDKMPDYAILR